MKCPVCGGEKLLAKVVITKMVPMAMRGGSIKIGGQKISQADLKTAWDKTGPGAERTIKGPFLCTDCDSELFYVAGAKNNPYVGSHEAAKKLGAQHFVDGGTMDSEGNP